MESKKKTVEYLFIIAEPGMVPGVLFPDRGVNSIRIFVSRIFAGS